MSGRVAREEREHRVSDGSSEYASSRVRLVPPATGALRPPHPGGQRATPSSSALAREARGGTARGGPAMAESQLAEGCHVLACCPVPT
ncbi:hypothetical protein ACFPM0_28505 [Pseudonocardia sulfidoxydans]|uniref:hypothetical protein n=1 Tax=Pseudonocardia sulfidoxydans TaxID=54011 RepID=UPI003620855B